MCEYQKGHDQEKGEKLEDKEKENENWKKCTSDYLYSNFLLS